MSECKIVFNDLTSEDIIEAKKLIKDILFTYKAKDDLFKSKTSLSKEEFTKIVLSKGNSNLRDIHVHAVYNSITKTDRDMTKEEFNENFMKKPDKDFEVKSIQRINEKLRQKNFNSDEYFDHLLAYKVHKGENRLSLYDFQTALAKENYGFSAQEIESLFYIIDTKKDNYIDREEWTGKIKSIYEPMFKILDIIKKNGLEIEDIMFRMHLDPGKNEFMDNATFKTKIKLLDNSLDLNFIQSLFLRLKNSNNQVESKTILKEFNVYKKENTRELISESFKANFMNFVRKNTNYVVLKQNLESIDAYNNGLLNKVEFCNVLNKAMNGANNDYKDEDIMKFLRITNLFRDNKVKFPEFLDLIFFDSKSDNFLEIVAILNSELQKAKNDYKNLIATINIAKVPDFVDINTMYSFLKTKIEKVNKNTVCKLDLDQDGKISRADLKGIIDRYLSTSFFKYNNNAKDIEVNIFVQDELTDDKFKQIVKDIRVAMKAKNLTDIGLFKKFDVNGCGFFSHSDFNRKIDEILILSPSVKDQFFTKLDNRKLGIVDQETFLKIFKEFTNAEVIIKNNWEVENFILDEFKKYIKMNKHLSDNEIFIGMDFDYDGIISLDDLKMFCLDKLKIAESDINKYKLERIIQQLSLTKNTNLTMFDVKEFVNKIKVTTEADLKKGSTLRFTKSTSNLHHTKASEEWIEAALERLGLYVSSKWDSLEDFFYEFSNKTDKLKLDDFRRFTRANYQCFEGFNFSDDEIIVLYSAIDSHKKSFITLEDFENKIGHYNFYKKMHHDIKNFVKFSLKDGIEAFKYFSNENTNSINTIKDTKLSNYFLSKKEFFDGINSLFPKKYQTNQILNYIQRFFKDPERIEFSELNYLYFDKVQKNEYLSSRAVKLSQSVRPRSNSASQQLATPYDKDPLEKVKRLLRASKFDITAFFKMYEIISNGWLNHSEFSNMLKKMNLGLTIKEIEKIMSKVSRSPEGLLNLKEFIEYMKNTDPSLKQVDENVHNFLGEIKHCIYKYFANPRLAFEFNEESNVNEMSYDRFKTLVTTLFKKESKPVPNFSLLKNSFDYIDIRKDGKIDLNEWLRTFTYQESALDVNNYNSKNQLIVRELREWENSREVSTVYSLINRNRKGIREQAKGYIINKNIINSENLISILEKNIPEIKMSKSQWKILVSIADREKNGLIDFELFLTLANSSSKLVTSHPKFQF